jgi:hypothetical protein
MCSAGHDLCHDGGKHEMPACEGDGYATRYSISAAGENWRRS